MFTFSRLELCLCFVALVTVSLKSSLVLVSAGWIDPDTPEHKRSTSSYVDNSGYHLVFSDEFDVPGKSNLFLCYVVGIFCNVEWCTRQL